MGAVFPPTSVLPIRQGPYCLRSFNVESAAEIASWAADNRELFLLAPRTEPPLTAAKVQAWPAPDGSPMVLTRDGEPEPIGYLELNPMPAQPRHYWLGHCIVGPQHRGCGLGRLMVGMALVEAFDHRAARRVSLSVFPDNVTAIRCYHAAGLSNAGEQTRYFATTRRQHRMLRMSVSREEHALARARAEST